MADTATAAPTLADDIDAIQSVIVSYFHSMYLSDPTLVEVAFHEKAAIAGHLDGRALWLSRADFAGFVANTPAPASTGEEYDMKIVSLSVNGDTAVAVVRDLYLGKRFTDTLSLLRLDGRWAIANKVFTHA